MSLDVTSLSISVTSHGVADAAKALEALSVAATNVEGKTKTIKEATSGLSASQQQAATNIEKLIMGFQKQADLLGANQAQTNAYTAAMKGASAAQQSMSVYLGAEVDAYRKLSAAQSEAIRMNKALDASRNLAAQRRDIEMYALSYKELGAAQAEAIRMNKALDAEQSRLKTIQHARETEAHAASVRAYSAAQAEAIRMNNAMDAASRKAAAAQQVHNVSMAEGHALARGLSGSLGALWMTYGSFVGLAAGIAIGASLKGIVTVGKDVEHTLEGIRVKGGETVESVNAIRNSIMDLGKGVYGPQEIAKAFETLILAGRTAKEALAGINDALNLATIGGTSIEKSAYTIVQVGTALGYTAENYSRISDVIAMTAAVSMSSVETLSEAFKSGSVVGKLYGVTLEDIGTSLAALSNLGIQGSAAGTSLKNFYKELASGSEKVVGTLKSMKLTPDSFKDDEGNYKSLLEVVEKLATGLDGLKGNQQKLAIANLSNERGMKTAVELLDLYRQKVERATAAGEEHTSMAQMLREKIVESYGYAAIGAAQMSLTVESQFKSVSNTLKTVFIKAFQEVSPSLSTVATEMKTAFNSPEFINGITTIAVGVAKFTVALAENIPFVVKLFEAMLAYKAIGFIIGLLTSVAEGMLALKAAMDLSRISAIAFQASLGLIGIALLAAGAAYVYFTTERDKSNMSKSQQDAIKYSKDYATALEAEATRLEDQIDLMLRGKTARDAETESMYRQQMALAALKRDSAINEGTERFNKAAKNVTPADLAASSRTLPNGLKPAISAAVKEYTDAADSLRKVTEAANKEFERAQTAQERVIQANRTKETLRVMQEEEDKARNKRAGAGMLGGEPDKAAINDAYHKEIQSYQNQINAARHTLEEAKQNAQSRYKQGLIGERGLIDANYSAEIKMAEAAKQAIQEKINAAHGATNKLAAEEKYRGDLQSANQSIEAAEAAKRNKYAEMEVNNQKIIQKAEMETALAKHDYVAAYDAEFKKKHEVQLNQLRSDLDSEVDMVRYAEMAKVLVILKAQEEAGRAAAANKTALYQFNVDADKLRNTLKGVQTATEGQGLAYMFDAASAASAKYAAELPLLQAQIDDMRAKPIVDVKGIEEAQARMRNLGEDQRKLWSGVGESITRSLKSAFGSGGEAAGKLIKIAQDYNNLEVKSGSARIKSYGDAAGAAKGFFKEGTTGYKLMETAERTFRAIELAGMIQSLATSLTTDSAKAAGKAPAVMMEFLAQMGPWGWAAGAAAIAAVGIAYSGSGGGGGMSAADRQKSQGTGSVLGAPDAKSESIVNSLTIMEKNSGLGLAHNTTMIHYLKNVSDNISGLTTALMRQAGLDITKGPDDYVNGGVIGKISNSIFGGNRTTIDSGIATSRDSLAGVLRGSMNAVSYNQVKEDGGWFSSDSYSTNMKSLGADTNAQFTKAISNMAESIKLAAKDLGVGGDAFTRKLETFVVDIGVISAKGMTGEEVNKALQAAFSKLGDDMAKFAITGLDKFQKVGEGYLETVMRVANDLMQVKDVFAVLGKTFNLTGLAAVNVSESLISAVGGLDKLGEGAKFFVDNFLTEAEKMAPITSSVVTEMVRLGYGSVTTVESFSKLVRSLDLTDPASQKLYASLMDIAPAFKSSADYAQKLAEGTTSLTKAQQKALDAVAKAKSQLQDSYNSESSALQGTIDKTKTFITTLKNYQDGLKLGSDSPLTNMQKYAEARKQFDATAADAAGGNQAAKDKFTQASSALLSASKLINASGSGYTSDFNMVQNAIDTLMGSAGTQVDVAQASLNALNASVAGLIDINKSVMSVTDAIVALQNAITTGSAQGLSGAQMGTTYTPTPAQIAAATTSSSGSAPIATVQMVEQLATQFGEVKSVLMDMRTDNAAQTGAIVGATVKSSEDNAETIAAAVGSGGKNWKLAQIELV